MKTKKNKRKLYKGLEAKKKVKTMHCITNQTILLLNA